MKKKLKVWRHGEVIIKEIVSLPEDIEKANDDIIAYGETGNAHRLEGSFELYGNHTIGQKPRHLKVLQGGAQVVHPGHPTHKLPPGNYSIESQIEWNGPVVD